jgi:hypothetical protein
MQSSGDSPGGEAGQLQVLGLGGMHGDPGERRHHVWTGADGFDTQLIWSWGVFWDQAPVSSLCFSWRLCGCAHVLSFLQRCLAVYVHLLLWAACNFENRGMLCVLSWQPVKHFGEYSGYAPSPHIIGKYAWYPCVLCIFALTHALLHEYPVVLHTCASCASCTVLMLTHVHLRVFSGDQGEPGMEGLEERTDAMSPLSQDETRQDAGGADGCRVVTLGCV